MSRRVRHCCAGRAHPNPDAVNGGQVADQLKQCFVAWREMFGVVPQKRAWTPWQPTNCCGDNSGSSSRASVCMGHNYSHCARCSQCRVGDPRKSLKKNRGHLQRLRWKDVICDSAQRDDQIEGFEDEALYNTDGSGWGCPVTPAPQTLHRRTSALKEFVVNCPEEFVFSGVSDVPFVVLDPRCPANCSCRPRRVKRKVSRIDRLRAYESAVGVTQPVDNDWVLV